MTKNPTGYLITTTVVNNSTLVTATGVIPNDGFGHMVVTGPTATEWSEGDPQGIYNAAKDALASIMPDGSDG